MIEDLEPIKERPNYWGTPLEDWHKQNLEPLSQELDKILVAKSCQAPHCHNATTEDFCEYHTLEIDQSRKSWEDWKDEQLTLDNYFIPYEEL